MSNKRDYSGMKYGELTMLHYSRGRGPGKHALWLARCDCGNVVEIVGRDAERGATKNCGKHERSRRLIPAEPKRIRQYPAPLRRAFRRLLQEAVDRGELMQLELEEFQALTLSKCTLCEAPSVQTRKVPGNKLILRSGTGGYVHSNLAPICPSCFHMMPRGTILERLEYLAKVYYTLMPNKPQ